jgi:hypothetical protein
MDAAHVDETTIFNREHASETVLRRLLQLPGDDGAESPDEHER